jgi:tetratricopeptide (TPR) repeat protein
MDAIIEEFYGEVALVAKRASEAELSFRRALEKALVQDAGPAQRARLYDALGRSLEAQGRADVAYDAFRRAVAIDPAAVHAQARLKLYEHSVNDVP